jgi:hypothetical protein
VYLCCCFPLSTPAIIINISPLWSTKNSCSITRTFLDFPQAQDSIAFTGAYVKHCVGICQKSSNLFILGGISPDLRNLQHSKIFLMICFQHTLYALVAETWKWWFLPYLNNIHYNDYSDVVLHRFLLESSFRVFLVRLYNFIMSPYVGSWFFGSTLGAPIKVHDMFSLVLTGVVIVCQNKA